MSWKNVEVKEFLVLEPEDWTPEEWLTICKLFDTKPDSTEVIRLEIGKLDIFSDD